MSRPTAPEEGLAEVFVANGQLWRMEQTAWSKGWSDWLPHGAPSGSLVTGPVAAARSGDGRIEVFVVDTHGGMWNVRQTQPAGAWSGWNAVGSAGGGLDGRPALGRLPDGRLQLLARGNDLPPVLCAPPVPRNGATFASRDGAQWRPLPLGNSAGLALLRGLLAIVILDARNGQWLTVVR